MALTATQIAGPVPSRKTKAMLTYIPTVANARLASVTLTGKTPIYISNSGSDSNNGLTAGSPIQTITHFNTLEAASTGNYVACLQRGGKWMENTGVVFTHAGDGLHWYGDEKDPPPIIHQFRTGFTWTQEAGIGTNVYSTPLAACYHAQEDLDILNSYTQVASTAAVNSTPGSFFCNGTKLYVQQRAGGAPTSGTFGVVTYNNRAVDIRDVDGCFVSGVTILGYGWDDSNYPIHAICSGTNGAVAFNCTVGFYGRHAIGHNNPSSSGGIFTSIMNSIGLANNSGGSTHLVSFAYNGSQEWVELGTVSLNGAVPGGGSVTNTEVFVSHSGDGSSSTGLILRHGTTIRKSQVLLTGVTSAANLPAAASNEDQTNYIDLFTFAEPGALGSTEVGVSNGFVANRVLPVLQYVQGTCGTAVYTNTYIVNQVIAADLSLYAGNAYGFCFNGASSVIAEYCQFHAFNSRHVQFYSVLNDGQANTGTMRNCVFSSDGTLTDFYLAFGSQTALDNNVYSQVFRTGTSGQDYQNDATPQFVGGLVGRLDSPASLMNVTSNTTNERVPLQYDIFGRGR